MFNTMVTAGTYTGWDMVDGNVKDDHRVPRFWFYTSSPLWFGDLMGGQYNSIKSEVAP